MDAGTTGSKIILFGAGERGRNALQYYGRDTVAYFCDNAAQRKGTFVDGIEVISFEKMVELHRKGYDVVLTPLFPGTMYEQLREAGVEKYSRFMHDKYRFPFLCYEEKIKQNKRSDTALNRLVDSSRKLDLIQDVEEFTDLSLQALKLNKDENVDLMLWGESNFYGNGQVLLDYAEIDPEDAKYLPAVSHEDCLPNIGVEHDYLSAVIMSGEYYREKIHRFYPYVPYFSVGPYIQYARGIYDEQRTKEEKARNGKTLLVFLPHSIEGFERQFEDEQMIQSVSREYGSQFETILACVYWADLGTPMCRYAKKAGMKIVSAGFRFDTLFDRRLRTILEIADAVVCFDIGTFISYSLWANKPIARLPYKERRPVIEAEHYFTLERDDKNAKSIDTSLQQEGFLRLFDKDFRLSDEQKKWMNPYGGIDIVRSKEYIKNIVEISKDIWKVCEGDLLKYPHAVKEVYTKYCDEKQTDQMTILRQAVKDRG